MSAPAHAMEKFNFDLDLGAPQPKKRALSEEMIEKIKNDAHQQGLAQGRIEGEQAAMQRIEATLAGAVEKLASQGTEALLQVQDAQKTLHAQSVSLAHAIGVKIARGLIETKPAHELETLIGESLAGLNTAPHLVVRCHPDLVEILRDTVEARAVTAGFTGRLIVMGDPEIALGDGRMEWADGGIVRDTATAEAEIMQRVQAYLERHGLPKLDKAEAEPVTPANVTDEIEMDEAPTQQSEKTPDGLTENDHE